MADPPLPPFRLLYDSVGYGAGLYVFAFDDEDKPDFDLFHDSHEVATCNPLEQTKCRAHCLARKSKNPPWWCEECKIECTRIQMFDGLMNRINTAVERFGFTENLFRPVDGYPEATKALFFGNYRVFALRLSKTLVVLGGGGFKQVPAIMKDKGLERGFLRTLQAGRLVLSRMDEGRLRTSPTTEGGSVFVSGDGVTTETSIPFDPNNP